MGGKLSRLVYLAPPPPPTHQGFGSNSVISSFLLHHNFGIFSCNYSWTLFQPNWDVISNISLVTLVRGVGGKLSRLVYLAPCLGFVSGSVISQFLLHHNLGIFSCKRYKHYFSQTEMFTSNVQFGYPCLRGGGQAVQAVLSCPPTKDLGRTVSLVHSYCTIILEYLVAIIVEHYFSQTEMFTSNISLVTLVQGVGASCPGWFILPPPPPPRIWVKQCHQLILIVP